MQSGFMKAKIVTWEDIVMSMFKFISWQLMKWTHTLYVKQHSNLFGLI